MADLNDNNPITADGDYDLNVRPGRHYGITVAGTWGSGTATVKYHDGTNYVAYEDFALTADGGKKVFVPSPGLIRISLASSTSPSLTVTHTVQVA